MKKLIIALFSLIMTLCLSVTAFAAYVGDVNNDDKITASDARAILRHSAKLDKIADDFVTRADIDGNSKITAADARIALRMSAKLEDLKEDCVHDFTKTQIQEVTCDKDGIIEYKCNLCVRTYQDVTKATGHDFELVSSTEATCSKEGEKKLHL